MSKNTVKIGNVTVITDKATLTKRIETLGKDMKSIDNRIHVIGVSTMYHMREHGDWRGAADLVAAMPRSTRRKALIAWFEHFAPCEVDVKTSEFTLEKGRKPEDFDLEGAAETHFGDFTAERAPVPVTLAAIAKMVEGKLEKGIEQGHITDEQAVAWLDFIASTTASESAVAN